MKTFADVAAWCAGAAEQFDDPSKPVCQLFFHWEKDLGPSIRVRGGDLVGGMYDGALVLLLGPAFPPIQIPVNAGEPQITPEGDLDSYGIEQITESVWALAPSLNVPGLIHAFVVLHDVPSPAPWERRIIIAGTTAP